MKTRAPRISDTVFFKHQYITNPQVTPKTLVIKVASDLKSALKGMVSRNGETAEALQKFSELFTKIATAKSELAKAKEQQNNLQNYPNARQAVPLSRVADRPSTPASPLPWVPIDIAEEENNKPNHRYNTRSRTTSIMQEAMLACINITKPKFEISLVS